MSEEQENKLRAIDDATFFKNRRVLKLALMELDPHCHWCGVEVYDLQDTPRGTESPPRMATVDHTVTRFSRKKGERVLKVLACYTCNQKRGKEEEQRMIHGKG